MNQSTIFWPMGALALLTFTALSLIPFRRFQAAFAGRVTAADFRYGESTGVPPEVSIPNRNFMNLLELPTLFYPVCLMFYVTRSVDRGAVVAAWAYVICRAAHSMVHLTYNNVTHRLAAFSLSNLALGALWAMFFLRLS